MPTYREVLRHAKKQLADTDISDEAIQILLLELCNMNNANLYLQYEEDMPLDLMNKFQEGVKRLADDEPLQYILGYQQFYGYKIKVTPDVLIPRYETEELVANVLADSDYYFGDYEEIEIADVGTGSGAIAIALKLEEPKYNMKATDISQKALEVAKDNAITSQVDIDFYQGDMLQPLIDNDIKLDILVSNPPYIPREQVVQKSVEEYEPHVALFGGDDGLDFYKSIFENANKVLKEKSFMAFEIGYDESERLTKLVEAYFPNDNYEVLKDINGKDRLLFVYHNLKVE